MGSCGVKEAGQRRQEISEELDIYFNKRIAGVRRFPRIANCK